MYGCIEPLAKTITKQFAHQAKSFATVVHLVAMPQEETFAQQVDGQYIAMDHRPDLLGQVIKHPDVVVAGKEMDLHASIGELR